VSERTLDAKAGSQPRGKAPEALAGSGGGDTRTPILHRLLGTAARVGVWLLQVLPAPLAYGIGRMLAVPIRFAIGRIEARSARKGRGIARNLKIAFRADAEDPRFVRRVLDGYARHIGRSLVDLCRLPCITRANLFSHIVEDAQWNALREVIDEGTGVIGVTGHIGSPELLGHAASVALRPLHSLMRPVPIRPLDELLRALRSCGGQVPITKWGGIREARRLIAEGKIVAMLIDENEKRAKSATFTPFLGTRASTPTSAAILHLRTQAPIVVGTMHRVPGSPFGRRRYRFHAWDIIRFDPMQLEDTQADVHAICERINRGLSAAIRAYPEEWFWGMRRFATRPEGEQPGPDGLPPVAPGAREAEEELARARDAGLFAGTSAPAASARADG
jgi:KDO2-lipid IV(A) lauroyltransferase